MLQQARHWQAEFVGDVVLVQVGAFIERLPWPPRGLLGQRRNPLAMPDLRRLRPNRRGAVQGFPLEQWPRRRAALLAAGRSVALIGQQGPVHGGLLRRVPVERWVPRRMGPSDAASGRLA